MKRLNLQIYEKFVDSYAGSEFKIRPSDSDDHSRLFLKLVRSEHLEIYRVVLNHWSKKLLIQQQLLALSRFSSFNNRIFRDPIRTEWVDDGRRTKFVDYWVELHDREFLLKNSFHCPKEWSFSCHEFPIVTTCSDNVTTIFCWNILSRILLDAFRNITMARFLNNMREYCL